MRPTIPIWHAFELAGDHADVPIARPAKDFPATLLPTDLREAVLDAATTLKDITLGDAQHGTVRVADLRWGGANLAVIDWTPLIEPAPQLGDERIAWAWKPNHSSGQTASHLVSNCARRAPHTTNGRQGRS